MVQIYTVLFFLSTDFWLVDKTYSEQVKQLGLEVQRLRKVHKISKQELAYRCGVDRRTIERIERGMYGSGLYILFALADAFELEPSELLEPIRLKSKK